MGFSHFDKNSGNNLLFSTNCVGNQSSMPPILPLVSQSIHFPQNSQDPGNSHRSSNPQISRSSSLPQINFLGQDSSGIQYPFMIQSSMVPQTSLDSHLSVPRESSIANVPLADSGNSSLGNGHDGNACRKKRIEKGDEENGNVQNVEVNLQKEVNVQSGVNHVVVNIADKGK
ncbi:unnamed protein product [Ilex paraguariensis]|uniref:Uncharacterized protein n=1 Tax=Ilex paraguariensis TaxID=185542 RepID=A0ABC8RZ03_9AQUA